MDFPNWTKPALAGAGAGAVAAIVVGFAWGGWVTGGSASDMASQSSISAVALALTPYCVEKSQMDPNRVALFAEMDAAPSYKKREVVEKAGWATPLGAENPSRSLANACTKALEDEA